MNTNKPESENFPSNRDIVKRGELSDILLTCPKEQRKQFAKNCLGNLKRRKQKPDYFDLHVLLNTVLFSMVDDQIEMAISGTNSDLYSITQDKVYEILLKHESEPYYMIKNDYGLDTYVPIDLFIKTEYKTA
jgi:hypothetical protein